MFPAYCFYRNIWGIMKKYEIIRHIMSEGRGIIDAVRERKNSGISNRTGL